MVSLGHEELASGGRAESGVLRHDKVYTQEQVLEWLKKKGMCNIESMFP